MEVGFTSPGIDQQLPEVIKVGRRFQGQCHALSRVVDRQGPIDRSAGQLDGTGTASLNFASGNFVGVGGSTVTGQSTQELDSDTFTTTASGLKQIGISTDPDNSDTSSANCNAYVVFATGENVFTLATGI